MNTIKLHDLVFKWRKDTIVAEIPGFKSLWTDEPLRKVQWQIVSFNKKTGEVIIGPCRRKNDD